MAGDRVRGPWEEEQQTKFFDGAKTFDDIFELIRSAAPGSLTDSSGNEINPAAVVVVRDLAQQGKLVGGIIIKEITRKYGLREAVVRAMAPDFLKVSGGNLDYIIQWLLHVKTQQDGLQGVESGSGKPLTILFDSSGNPVNVDYYISTLNSVKNWLAQNPGHPYPADDDFYMQFTGNNGLRESIMKALGRV
ncbi:MAG: hypothetical protein HYT15_00865 [Candidatus Magasanikbacteria bacterium]|nr:hypothetical protein [Candidatus Magasanikbacteria bacterium]